MSALVRSELLKHRSTRTVLGLALAMVALVLFAVLLHGSALAGDQLASTGDQMKVFGWGGLGALFAALAGALSITGEIRHGTVRPTFLVTPRRGRVIAAKTAVAGLTGIAFGLLAEGVAIGLGNAVLGARGIDVRLDGGDYAQLLAGGVAAAALWGPIGLGLGALLRNQVATLVGLFAWLLFVENLLIGQLPGAGRLLPGAAGAAIAGATTTGQIRPTILAPAAGAALLVAYAAASVAAGWIATIRRDVA